MRIFSLGLLLTTACAFSAVACADAPLTSGNVQFMTNYVGRGLAQSLGQPSVEGEIDLNSGDGLYGGVDANSINWVNEVWPGDSVSMEIDGWAGWRQHIGPDWVTKVGFLRLQFPGKYVPQTPPTDQPNTTEAFGYVAWKSYSVRLNVTVTDAFATPDSKRSWYLDLNGSQALATDWTLAEHLGRNDRRGSNPMTGVPNSRSNYTDYKLSVAYAFGEGVSLTLAHTWTNASPAVYTLNGYFVAGHHTWLLLEKDF
jgi:uncharacterized protein (TIGR02001 family)